MKKKITLQLPTELLDRLKTVAEERGVNRAIVVEKALAQFLAETGDVMAAAADPLGRFEDQLQGIQRELKSVAETVALHARYNLAWTSLVRNQPAEQAAGGDLGSHNEPRGHHGSASHADPDHSGQGAYHHHSSDDDVSDRPFGAPTRHAGERARRTTMADVSWGLPAAQEGGSEDPFRLSPPGTLG